MRRPQQILIAVGVLVFALGAGPALLASQLSASPVVEVVSHVDMTAEECVTCHSDEYRAVERAVQPVAIVNARVNDLEVAPAGWAVDSLSVIEPDGETRPYAVTSAKPETSGRPVLRYLMRTDQGYSVVPEMWSALSAAGADADALCEACHFPTPTAPATGVPRDSAGL